MNLNYTYICHYCGAIYKSNKSTKKYCRRQHNSLYHANGSNIDYTILNSQNLHVSYYDILSDLYKTLGITRTWTCGYSIDEVKDDYNYQGPLPEADELLFVSGFLIQKKYWSHKKCNYYYFKPMQFLTKREKAINRIEKVGLYILWGDY